MAKRKTNRRAVKRPAKRAAKAETVLVMRTCKSDMSSHSGFVWPTKGPVSCKDWSGEKRCGNGLHGLLWGCGDGSLLDWSPDAKWLIVEVRADEIVDLDGKVKFPRGGVVHVGDRTSATKFIYSRKPDAQHVVAGTATAGVRGTATAGVRGTATAGYAGTATAGDEGTATAGVRGTATAGVRGTATAGDEGTATAGDEGVIIVTHWDGRRYRRLIGKIGEAGLEPGVPYKVSAGGKFVRADGKDAT